MTQGFQLSPQQKHLWQLQPDRNSQVFHTTGAIQITGYLNLGALELALGTIVAQHEILRTLFGFPAAMSIPVQVIQLTADLSLPLHDLTEIPEEDQSAQASIIFDEMIQGTAVDTSPAFHAALFRFNKTNYQLHLWLPALNGDATSFLRLVEQLSAAYEAALAEGELEIETLQYADFAEWQNGLFEDEEAQAEGDEWYRRLLSAPLDIHLPLEQTPESEDIFEPNARIVTLDKELTAQITAVAEANDVSVSTVLLAAWRILLWHLGQTEMVLGLGCDGRTYEELEDAIGLFATTLPVASELDGSETLPNLLTSLEDTVIESYNSQEYFSWAQLPQIGETDPTRHYFPIAFNYHDLANDSFQAGNVTFTIQSLFARTDRFHLLLTCYHQNHSLHLVLDFDQRRFGSLNIYQEETEDWRLMNRLLALLSDLVSQPKAAVQDFSILPMVERHQLLKELNHSQTSPPATTPIHQLIAEQAAKRPNETAVQMGSQILTYSQLDQQSTQLAAFLQTKGVEPNKPVGILLNTSPEAVVAIIAVHKAGGAYIPIDPQYPAERIAYVIEDTQAPVLITEQNLNSPTLHQTGAEVVLLDEFEYSDISVIENSPGNLNDLAYFIYTSGSTGTPKGVAVTHGNLAHSTTTRFTYYEKQPERFLLLSSFAFDSSIVGLFWTLSQGGTLVLASANDIRDPQALAAVFDNQSITHTLALPSLYQLLLTEADPKQLTSLQTVIVAGESCPPSLVEQHQKLIPQTALYNEYGPTEGTVWCTVFDCTTAEIGSTVPIGRPIPNSEIYILGPDMESRPIGVPGELYIGGPGVAQGYYNRPKLTAERFLAHPFKSEGKIYRTGDLARFLPDGTIEFLGRADQQIKIRGYRVELGEVENVLASQTAVQEAVVVSRSDNQNQPQLVAYVTAKQAQAVEPQTLRDHLLQKLPPYMVPATFVILDKLPRTPNGKVNRRALPDPAGNANRAASAYVAPRSALESVLAGVWSDLLDYERIGINDNFFNLGGHSILVTQLVSRLRTILPVDLPLRIIFDKPTVAELADHIKSQSDDAAQIEITAELLLQVATLSEAEAEAALAGN